jgi:hypothetical protein
VLTSFIWESTNGQAHKNYLQRETDELFSNGERWAKNSIRLFDSQYRIQSIGDIISGLCTALGERNETFATDDQPEILNIIQIVGTDGLAGNFDVVW